MIGLVASKTEQPVKSRAPARSPMARLVILVAACGWACWSSDRWSGKIRRFAESARWEDLFEGRAWKWTVDLVY